MASGITYDARHSAAAFTRQVRQALADGPYRSVRPTVEAFLREQYLERVL